MKTRTPALTRTTRERTILQAYCGHPVSPAALAEAIAAVDLDGEARGEHSPTELDAAVAIALLRGIRASLPQWAAIRSDGELVLGRRNTKATRSKFAPQHLFTLNWADSGPGFSWPMAYHATRVAEFNRVIVTASADCPDAYGFTDFGIGSFDIEHDLLEGVHEVIVADWKQQAARGQRRWAYLFDEAIVSSAVAEQWADEFWGVEAAPELDEDEDSE